MLRLWLQSTLPSYALTRRKARPMHNRRRRSMDVYKPAGVLSDMVRHNFDKWNKNLKNRPQIECAHQQYKRMKAKFLFSNFSVL